MALAGESLHLDRAVRSLAAAGVAEVAVADATGDPRTRARFEPIADRISAYFFEPDNGQSDGINKAMAALSSPIVGWLNDDDFLAAGAAADAANAFATTGADAVFGETIFFDTAGRALGYHPNISQDPQRNYSGCWISQPSCFFSRDLFTRVGALDQTLHYVMDWDLWLKMLDAGARFQHLPRLLSGVTLDPLAKTSHVRLARMRELYACGRRHGRAALPAAAFAARAMAGGALWGLAGGEAPPFPYFAMWAARGGPERAPDICADNGALLFHLGEEAASEATILWRDGSQTSAPFPHPPYERARLHLGRPLSDIRTISLR